MSSAHTWSPITLADADDWAELLKSIAEADRSDEHYRPEDLVEELSEPGVDPALDTVLVRDETGRTVAYGQVRVRAGTDTSGVARAEVGGGVHPQARGAGLGRAVLAWSQRRAGELVRERHPHRPATATVFVPEHARATMRLAERCEYEQVRWFLEMTRRLDERPLDERPLDASPTPSSVVVRGWQPEDADGLYRAHVAAFADHWQWAAPSEDAWRAEFASRTARPELSVVVIDDRGSVLAYVEAREFTDRELYIARVGTVAAARGRGLARLALTEVLRRAVAAADHDLAKLHVDADSPTGAGRLYEALGFVTSARSAAYQRTL